ncbi:MAG TPA: M1 family metallopeptidase, partial [Thermoanaerobaculia bacterium]|nr:M1 family metallopeptidase [Thermoanaerobaculia bacterium]
LRLGTTVEPTFQRVVLELDPAATSYRGHVDVALTVLAEASAFRLHAEEMEIDALTLARLGGEAVPASWRALDHGLLEVTPERPLAPGLYALDVEFTNDFGTRSVGLYRTEFEDEPYLFTQFQATDAREAFPVWDEPGVKLPYQLEVTVPAGQLAVSNTPVVASVREGDRDRVTFARTEPLPAYLLALAVGPFETVDIPGMSVPGRVVVPKGRRHLAGAAVDMTPKLLAALEEWFGTPYPYAKLDLVAVPEFWPGAMENAGAVTFKDSILLIDPATGSPAQLRNLARINAHELAHMWFGDLVTMRWWDDFWLNESFADWMGVKIADQVYPELGVESEMLGGVQWIFGVDARPSAPAVRRPVHDPVEAMETVGMAYAKGRAVLGMVEHWLGPEVFRRGVNRYIAAHAGGNAVAADLWSALAAASGEDVEAVMGSFLDQPGYPLVQVERTADGAVVLRQSRFANAGSTVPAQRWRVPVALAWSDGETVHHRAVRLDGPTLRLELGPVEWLLPDAGAHGYYRWQLPAGDLLALAGRSSDVLSPREAIAFLGNAGALLDAGALGGDEYLRLLSAFAGDPRPEVADTLVAGLAKVRDAFVPADLEEPFAAYVRRTLRPALDRIGLERRAGEPESATLLRPTLLAWLGDEGRDPEVREHARRLARLYLEDPARVDPALGGTVLELAAIDGDLALFEAYRQRFEQSKVPLERDRYLDALGAFGSPEVQERALAYALEGPLRAMEVLSIPLGVAGRSDDGERAFAWITGHYRELAERIPSEFVGFMPMLASGCSERRLEQARAFFGDPERAVDGTARSLLRVGEQVEQCVALRQREGEAVAAYLRSAGGGSAGARP